MKTPSRGRPAKYMAEACMTCRSRRIKCDGEKPLCFTCANFGRECSWGKDERKPRAELRLEAMQKRIVALNEYISRLESMVDDCRREHGGTSDNGEGYMDRDDFMKEDQIPQVDELADKLLLLHVDRAPLGADTEPLVS